MYKSKKTHISSSFEIIKGNEKELTEMSKWFHTLKSKNQQEKEFFPADL